jgi:hypothetical protein
LFFAQSNRTVIQRYLSTRAKIKVTNSDFNDWAIQSDGAMTTPAYKIAMVQRYKGIEIFRAVSNFSIKTVKLLMFKN